MGGELAIHNSGMSVGYMESTAVRQDGILALLNQAARNGVKSEALIAYLKGVKSQCAEALQADIDGLVALLEAAFREIDPMTIPLQVLFNALEQLNKYRIDGSCLKHLLLYPEAFAKIVGWIEGTFDKLIAGLRAAAIHGQADAISSNKAADVECFAKLVAKFLPERLKSGCPVVEEVRLVNENGVRTHKPRRPYEDVITFVGCLKDESYHFSNYADDYPESVRSSFLARIYAAYDAYWVSPSYSAVPEIRY